MDKFSYIGTNDVNAIEALFQQYSKDPNSVDASWRDFFKGFEFAQTSYSNKGDAVPESVSKEFKVINLINNYRQRGHLFTKTNPVRERRHYTPTLDIENFDLAKADLETVFHAGNEVGIGASKLKDIVAHLEQTYCGSIGVEYLFMREPIVLKWLTERMEKSKNTPSFNKEEKKSILNKLTQAVVFENYLATKFVGQKRFSLEGGEALIPAMHSLMEHGANLGIQDYIIGMPHRGRLSVLTNIMHKTYKDIFTEFEGRPSEDSLFDGDVKYHLGYSSDQVMDGG
ncbi:MAG TPA: 2-oxoglutarate dehydrogenase E1 component, partial [Bacteroidia bacterium]